MATRGTIARGYLCTPTASQHLPQGKWFRGIVDELQRDNASGTVSFVEHKTRHRPSTPGALQQDTARLQLMLYRALLDGLRHMPAAQVSHTIHFSLLFLSGQLDLSSVSVANPST